MKVRNEWTAMPSCVHNTGATCEGVSPRCKYCGWNPKVSARRIAAIQAGDLTVNADGRKYLDVSKFQNAPQIPEERKNADAV